MTTVAETTRSSLVSELVARMRVNLLILKTGIAERLVYRADFVFSTFVRFLPIVTQIFLWRAIFDSNPESELQGYTYQTMVAYYLLAMLARAFSSMPGLATGIAESVRNGSIRKYLIQPVDMLDYLFWHRVAHKLVYYVIAAGPFALVFWLCRDYLPGWPSNGVVLACALSLVMAFLIGFLIEALIGLIAFWFLEVSSLIFVYMMLNYFLSGHMIPLEWLSTWIPWVNYLPFRYLAWFPAAIMLGRVPEADLPRELLIQFVWVLALLAANRIVFRAGLRRYSAFGG